MLESLILTVLIPALVGGAVTYAMSGLKAFSLWVAGLNPWLQRGVVGLISTGAVALSSVLGVPVPSDVFSMDGQAVSTVLTALFAMLYHFIRKKAAA